MASDEHEPQQVVADVLVDGRLEIGSAHRAEARRRFLDLAVLAVHASAAAGAASIARFFAVAMSHAPGLSGMPVSGQRSSAVTRASCARSSARPTSRTMRDEAADQPGGLDPPDRLDGLARGRFRFAHRRCLRLLLPLDLGAQPLLLRAQLRGELLAEVLGVEDGAKVELDISPGIGVGRRAPTRRPPPST